MNNYPIPLKSYNNILLINKKSKVRYYFWGMVVGLALFLFLPWTQNIKSKGNITSMGQEQRPQKINSPIPGKISKWLVKEGDFVNKGDTIVILSEIKEDYLDPNLIGRTQAQVDAKRGSIDFYEGKITTTQMQMVNLEEAKRLKIAQLNNKIAQTNNKIKAEQSELLANRNENELLRNQFDRQLKMYEDGLISQTLMQERNIKFQNSTAKQITTENKLAQSIQELTGLQIEKNSAEQEYTEKINKAAGDNFQNQSQISNTQADVAKLENQVSNYTIRNGMYIVTAPQDGQIVQANKSGIGEILKEGETLTIIVPERIDYAVEMYVRPMDLPLIDIGQEVRFTFDGFPAIVFSGWPNSSYGTFGGIVTSFENTIGENGLYRVLVAEDKKDKKWPEQLRMGAGSQGIVLLKNVPIWYEVWRNINGFPPDFYQVENQKKK